jgi:transposase
MIPSSVRIFVCTQPQDMRRAFDGLALSTRQVLGENPQSGALFLFVNKRANRVKVLWWDRNGYCLLCKRLHRAKFVLPDGDQGRSSVRIDGRQLAEILAGVEMKTKRQHTS